MRDASRSIARREFVRRAAAAAGGALISIPRLTRAIEPARPSAWPPLTPEGTFEMLVLGDSIMWGEGHDDGTKFTRVVHDWLQSKMPGVSVRRHVFAHCGAQIKANEKEDAKPPTHGEIPNYFPSIVHQVRMAVMPVVRLPMTIRRVDPTDVALVLVDGGINDIGTKKILTPDPTVDHHWVRRVTREQVEPRMRDLLTRVSTTFPNAKIVFTNYFQIVSSESDMVLVWELLRMWGLVGPVIDAALGPLQDKLAKQSFAFHDESSAIYRQLATEFAPSGRLAFASVPYGPRNSYGAPETYLFYVNQPDPAANERKPACMALSSIPDPNCLYAAAGHPNLTGEPIYAQAITRALEELVPEWRPPLTLPLDAPILPRRP